MGNVNIYVLFDPLDGQIRYVGKTKFSLDARLRGHLNGKSGTHCRAWVNSLIAVRRKPQIKLIEVCESGQWKSREKFWIAYFRWSGLRLCNLSDGGDGVSGYSHTDEAKAKISAAFIGKPKPGVSAARRGIPLSDAHKSALSVSAKGRVISPEQRAKISSSLRGRKPSEETREKYRSRVVSDEARRKLSAAAKRQWADGRGWKAAI